MRYIVALVLLWVIGSQASAQLLSDARDYHFIFALSGSAFERELRDINGTLITGANGCDRVVIERTRVDGYACPPYQARITADLTVTTVVSDVIFTTPAMAVVDAGLELTGLPGEGALSMVAAPESLAVTADIPFDKPAEMTVYSLREQIAELLSVSIPLGGLTRLIGSNPFQSEYLINSYQEGFLYIVQVYTPVASGAQCPPHIFRTGNVFTVSIGEASVEALISWALRQNELLGRFGEDGLPDANGRINVNDVGVNLCWGNMLVRFTGTDSAGRQRAIDWLMRFDRGIYGVDIMPVGISVDGVQQAVPAADEEYINPVSQAFFGVMRSAGGGMEIIAGTLGLTSITYGEIRPEVLIMAGRQW